MNRSTNKKYLVILEKGIIMKDAQVNSFASIG